MMKCKWVRRALFKGINGRFRDRIVLLRGGPDFRLLREENMTMGLLGWKVMVVLAGLAGVVSTDHAFDRHAVTDQQPRPVMVRVDDEIAAEDCTHFHTRLEVSGQFAEKMFCLHRIPLQVERC